MSGVHEVRIRSVANGGAGVGKATDGDGRTWFVDGALPDELVEARIDHEARKFIRGTAVRVIEAAPARAVPPCELAGTCGGCGWQHVEPSAQVELKRLIVADQLRRLPLRVEQIVPSPRALGYRRRARLHYTVTAGHLELGFHRLRSREVVDVPTCPVLCPELDAAVGRVRELVAHLPDRGEVWGLSNGREVVLGLPGVRPSPELETACEGLLDSTLVGFAIRGGRRRRNIGKTQIDLDGGGGTLPVVAGPFSFAQAQKEQNRALVEHVVRSAHANRKRVLELYAGNGNFTRALARFAERVWTFDEDRESVASLRELATAHELSINAKHGSADVTLAKLAKAGRRYDVVVLDPPRTGLGKAASHQLAKVVGERVIYVSCDPATLARDLAVLIEEGLVVEDVRVFDMMPMTPEVETVVTLLAPSRPGGEG